MIKRHLEQKLESALKQYPVVSITGPRQSGKTTLMKSTLKNYDYVSLEDPDYRADAMDDPRGFLGQFTSNVMLDEVQQVPALFSYIQGIVDQVDKPGQFVLSGSHNFLLMERISQSLAGRCAILHLMPFSRSELLGQKPMNISNIGKAVSRTKADTKEKMFDMLFKGFYPRIHDKNLAPQNWLANYYQSYIERDVRNIINIGDVETFGRFVRLCAGRSGQMLNMASLASDSGVSAVTVKRWLSILQASFIVKLLMPHHKNFRKRLVKSPKLYFLDTGLLCYLLRIRSSKDLEFHSMRGPIFESWVVAELLKNYYHQALEPDIYFWRDSAGHEVDVIIDSGSALTAIEIKSGQTIGSDFLKALDYFRALVGQPNMPAVLVYGGDRVAKRRGISIIPWKNWL